MTGQARFYSSTAQATTVTDNPLLDNATMLHVAATTGFPTSYPYTLIIDRDTANEEVVTVTTATGLALTVTRGEDGTTAVQHNQGASVEHGVSARDFSEPQVHMDDASIHYPRMGLADAASIDPLYCTDTFTLADGEIHYYAFRATENFVASGIAFDVTVAGGANSDIEVGVYSGGTSPGTLLGHNTLQISGQVTSVSPALVWEVGFTSTVNIHAGTVYWLAIRNKAGSGSATLLGKTITHPEIFGVIGGGNSGGWISVYRAAKGTGTSLTNNPTVTAFNTDNVVALWLTPSSVGNIDFG